MESLYAVSLTVLLVVGLPCAIISAIIAHVRSKDRTIWFILGFFLGPLGILLVAILPGTAFECPRCGTDLNRGASMCPQCQIKIDVTRY